MKRIAILQSNYIPWRGYFDLIASVDEFVLYDDMQYTRRDWRNRNRIKTANGVQWLSVPVKVKGKYHNPIRSIEIDDPSWASKHWRTLEHSYARAPFFNEIATWLKPLYLDERHVFLSEMNRHFLQAISHYIGIETVFRNSWDYPQAEGKTERLVSICEAAGGTEYISGPSAKSYIDEDVFKNHGIKITWFDYSTYSDYTQLFGEFVADVSIVDLLFNCGPQASRYMRYVKKGG